MASENSGIIRLSLGESTTSPVAASGDANIDGLLHHTSWSSTTITYSFPNSIDDYDNTTVFRLFSEVVTQEEANGQDFSQFTGAQQEATKMWLDMVSDVTGLSFAENSGSSDSEAVLKFANGDRYNYSGDGEGITAYAFYPSGTALGGNAWFGQAGQIAQGTSPDSYVGNYHFTTIGHELGHTLGLRHGHETNVYGAMEPEYDSMEYSIMTYRSYEGASTTTGYTNAAGSFAQTLMMYDIAALQYIYGANYSSNSGNTTYTWDDVTGAFYINGQKQFDGSSTAVFQTIWDGGGEKDHYDLRNFDTDLLIDLRPGGSLDFDTNSNQYAANLGNGNYASGQVYNALLYQENTASLIERATGGKGADEIHGNQANNKIWGRSSDDILYGHEGNDVIFGGQENDTIYGGTGNDKLKGGDDNDTLYGETGNDRVIGGDGNDILFGNEGNDNLKGNDGADLLNGGSGDDKLQGGSGSDQFIFDNISDDQRDIIRDFEDGTDLIVIHGYEFDDLTIENASGGDSTITVGNTSIVVRDVSADLLTESDFEFV